jgi:sepiapterin reductase
MLLKHTVYIITGANRGFGKAIAETIASKVNQEKTSFILVGRDQSQLENVKFEETKFISCHYIANANFKGAKQAKESVIDQISNLVKVSYLPLFFFLLLFLFLFNNPKPKGMAR